MPDFGRDPSERISVAGARDLIMGRRPRGFEISPRPPRLVWRLRRRRFEILTVGFGAAWLALPRSSTIGLLCLVAAVAAGRMVLEKRRGRR